MRERPFLVVKQQAPYAGIVGRGQIQWGKTPPSAGDALLLFDVVEGKVLHCADDSLRASLIQAHTAKMEEALKQWYEPMVGGYLPTD